MMQHLAQYHFYEFYLLLRIMSLGFPTHCSKPVGVCNRDAVCFLDERAEFCALFK
jgi:hypothetical protein